MDDESVLGGDFFKLMEGITGMKSALFLVFLNAFADGKFQRASKATIESTNGQHKAAPFKGYMRMIGKLKLDHKDEDEPKWAANIDGVRNAGTFEDAASMQCCSEALGKEFDVLRLKTTLDPEFDAVGTTFG